MKKFQFESKRRSYYVLAVAFVAIVILFIPGFAFAGPTADYGDAPDDTNNPGNVFAYPGVVAKFPSIYQTVNSRVATRKGAHHVGALTEWMSSTSSVLSTTTETDVKIVDADEDDANPILYVDPATNMGYMVVRVAVASGGANVTRYINVLIDQNKDGEWRNEAVPEWVVINHPIKVPPGTAAYIVLAPIKIRPSLSLPVWVRITLTREEIDARDFDDYQVGQNFFKKNGWDGSAPSAGFAGGETEDWIFQNSSSTVNGLTAIWGGGVGGPPPFPLNNFKMLAIKKTWKEVTQWGIVERWGKWELKWNEEKLIYYEVQNVGTEVGKVTNIGWTKKEGDVYPKFVNQKEEPIPIDDPALVPDPTDFGRLNENIPSLAKRRFWFKVIWSDPDWIRDWTDRDHIRWHENNKIDRKPPFRRWNWCFNGASYTAQMEFHFTWDPPGDPYQYEIEPMVEAPPPHSTDPIEDTPYTFIESSSDTAVPSKGYSNDPYPSGAWKMGTSNWRYRDSHDAAIKYEGSYKEFDTYAAGGKYLTNPHGGYTTTSNKCKVCHAVHRANGAFKLMRVDFADNACDYCHVGSHIHSNKAAYSAGDGTVYPNNGHTMGSGKSIPDSSVQQWLEVKTLEGGDDLESEFVLTVSVRQYMPAKNKLMVWAASRASHHVNPQAITNAVLTRWGPTLLTCISCHQPHNATELIWRPDEGESGAASGVGYKLLRASPSGSVDSPQAMAAYLGGIVATGSPFAVIRVPEDTLSASNTGPGKSIYTVWKGSDQDLGDGAGATLVPQFGAWCADCHNVNIGHYESTNQPNFRGGTTGEQHSDRTHTAPGTYQDCFACHNTNFYALLSGYNDTTPPKTCSSCHWVPADYRSVRDASDWPHAGATTSTKLLDDRYDASTEHLDMICTRCHDLVGTSM